MNINSISASSYKDHDHCPHKFFISNVLKYRYPPGKAAELGKLVHGVLEYLALIKKSIQDQTWMVDKFGLQTNYKTIEEIDIPLLYREIYNFFVEQAKNCIFTAEDYNKGFTCVNCALESGDSPLKNEIVATEHYCSIPVNEPWATILRMEEGGLKQAQITINGIIDLIVKEDDDTLRIIDWKTGQRKDFATGKVREYESFIEDIQLSIYYFFLRNTYPEYNNIIITINYLKDGGAFTIPFTHLQYKKVQKKLKKKIIDIKNTVIPVLKKSWLCRFCDYSKNKFDNAPFEFRSGQINKKGEKMCICSHMALEIQSRGIESVTNIYKKIHDK